MFVVILIYYFIFFTVWLSASPVEVLSIFLTPMQRILEKARNLLLMMQCMTGSKCAPVYYDVVCLRVWFSELQHQTLNCIAFY